MPRYSLWTLFAGLTICCVLAACVRVRYAPQTNLAPSSHVYFEYRERLWLTVGPYTVLELSRGAVPPGMTHLRYKPPLNLEIGVLDTWSYRLPSLWHQPTGIEPLFEVLTTGDSPFILFTAEGPPKTP